jgi:PilZ domain
VGADEVCWSARVKDISRGGIKLHLNRPFEAGTMLKVDISTGEGGESLALMARVIHASHQGPASWSLGCAFERLLTEQELSFFRGTQKQPSEDERRAWLRLSCDPDRPARASVLINRGEKITAKVLNIAVGGVGLAVPRHCEPGTSLRLELIDPSGRTSRPIQARVIHSSQKGPDEWVVGCAFASPLSEEDVAALV